MLNAQGLPPRPKRSFPEVPGNDARHLHFGPEYKKDIYRVTSGGASNTVINVQLNFPHIQFPRDSYMVAVEAVRYAYIGNKADTSPGRAPTNMTLLCDYLTQPMFLPPSTTINQAAFTLESSATYPGDRDAIIGSVDATKEFRSVFYYPRDAAKLMTLGHVVPHDGLKFAFDWLASIPHTGATGTEVQVDFVFYPNPLYHAT